MPTMRLSFSGEVRKPQVKQIGQDQAVEFQLMRKNYGKKDEEATFTWIRVTVFKPQPWQIQQCAEGKFVAGSGEFTLRSYINKDGAKAQSAEVRCQSFDLDGPRTEERTEAAAAPAPAPRPAIGGGASPGEPPFARPLIAEVWG